RGIEANQVRDQFSANIDWYPTLAELCGIHLPARRLDGKSLVSIIADKNEPTKHDVFFWRQGGSKEKPQWAVRMGDWKLLRYPVFAEDNVLEERGLLLANNNKELAETRSLAQQLPSGVKHLEILYEAWLADGSLQYFAARRRFLISVL